MDSKSNPTGFRLLGFGSPLLDLLARVDDDFLRRHVAGKKGGTEHLDSAGLRGLAANLSVPPQQVPGGSAGNTVFALAHLGLGAALFGKVGEDGFGNFYRRRLIDAGGDAGYIITAPKRDTGICLALITPDGERTMRSHLGVSLELTDDDLNRVEFHRFNAVLVEGYMVQSPIFEEFLRRAKRAGCLVVFDPGSFELAERFRDFFQKIIREFVDVVLLNRAEAVALVEDIDPLLCIERIGSWCDYAVVKLGDEGALLKRRTEKPVKVPPLEVENPTDTTAAGDFFAAGFLYALAEGGDPQCAGKCGALLASRIIQVVGAELPEAVWMEIRHKLKAEFHHE